MNLTNTMRACLAHSVRLPKTQAIEAAEVTLTLSHWFYFKCFTCMYLPNLYNNPMEIGSITISGL